LRNARTRLWITALLAVVAASASLADLTPGTKAPNFTLPTLDGGTVTLSNYAKAPGKVVVMDIWATWCPPCRLEIPYLIDLQDKFKEKPVAILGVSLDKSKSDVTAFAKQQKINYTIALDPGADKLASLYKVGGIPTTYIIDKHGVIRYVHSGFPRDKAEQKAEIAKMEKEIRELLAKK